MEKEKANDGGRTPLMNAASEGDIEEIRRLLDVNARDDEGYTALMYAAMAVNVRTEAIRELLKVGADIEARNNNGMTALYLWQRYHKDHSDFQEISDLLNPKR
ncbi:MAG: ankyrin repeat domain-containing protein [Candidatus Dadabacteria bacterium]|nr:ankyrin repeat domain-containing protein [Candidatus Dadabacteria bacterium]